jgi:hypothetical protein
VTFRLASLPGVGRLAIGLFTVWVFGFHAVAQANLWVHDGGGSLPGPNDVLWKYHGRPGSTKLHHVLDPSLPQSDPKAMWPYLGTGPAEQAAARALILGWVDRGAPRDEWGTVAPIFEGEDQCAQCHAPGKPKADLPYDSYEHVLVVTHPDTGMPTPDLLVSVHNHAFGFTVLALLLSLGLAFSPGLGKIRSPFVVGAFAGAALDVGCWLLTKAFGAPFQYGVILGGGLFGATTFAMGLLVLDEVLCGGKWGAKAHGLFRRRPDAS